MYIKNNFKAIKKVCHVAKFLHFRKIIKKTESQIQAT